MNRWIALLRGINVSGKNRISMPELKESMIALGFTEVVTYLNSGNLAFLSAIDEREAIAVQIKSMIKDRFDLDIPVFVTRQEELKELLIHAPAWWGDDNKDIYDNLIFLMPPLSYDQFFDEIGEPNAEHETVQPYRDAVFWSFSRRDYQKTNWWSKTASSAIRSRITIRTANTVRKIADM